MQLTMTRTQSSRPILAVAMLALLMVALVASALFIGSNRRPLPAPFGPARNGAVVFDEAGDLLIADELSGQTRMLVAGPETDTWPRFSNQGDRIAFVRAREGGFQLMTVLPEGSGNEVVGEFPGEFNGFTWSPDGRALLVNFTETDHTGFRLAAVNADGSGSRELDLGFAADYGSWRPDGEHIVFRGQLDDGTAGAFIAEGDGTNVRQLPIESVDLVDFEGLSWSPDGKHLSFTSDGSLGGVTGWQINIADIAADGTLTELHRLKLDPKSTAEHQPSWSPDGSKLAFLFEKDFTRQVGIFNADGSDFWLAGPSRFDSSILAHTWAPDGKTLLINEFPENESRRDAARKVWSIDVATGDHTEVGFPIASWQRLAP